MPRSITEIKNRQTVKICQIIEALMSEGFCSLNEQAVVLGLIRSTVWNMRRGNHKGSGLSPKIIDRMLSSPQLPSSVRVKIDEYVEEKAAGNFMPVRARGHFGAQFRPAVFK
jgi:predicted DNA-binding transcriptional regulator AlpA